jgi:hypothetical protein
VVIPRSNNPFLEDLEPLFSGNTAVLAAQCGAGSCGAAVLGQVPASGVLAACSGHLVCVSGIAVETSRVASDRQQFAYTALTYEALCFW